MDNVHIFHTRESAAIDTDAIQTIKANVGERRCRTVVDGMVFAVTDALCQLERAVLSGDKAPLAGLQRQLVQLSGQLGLVCMADVLEDFATCLEAGDDVALAAVTARLIRIGEDSLYTLIEFTDRSIL